MCWFSSSMIWRNTRCHYYYIIFILKKYEFYFCKFSVIPRLLYIYLQLMLTLKWVSLLRFSKKFTRKKYE
jgi:hypothetical protein